MSKSSPAQLDWSWICITPRSLSYFVLWILKWQTTLCCEPIEASVSLLGVRRSDVFQRCTNRREDPKGFAPRLILSMLISLVYHPHLCRSISLFHIDRNWHLSVSTALWPWNQISAQVCLHDYTYFWLPNGSHHFCNPATNSVTSFEQSFTCLFVCWGEEWSLIILGCTENWILAQGSLKPVLRGTHVLGIQPWSAALPAAQSLWSLLDGARTSDSSILIAPNFILFYSFVICEPFLQDYGLFQSKSWFIHLSVSCRHIRQNRHLS